MKKKKISGAEAVIHSLLNEGVDLVWGYPGGAIMPVYDEFYKFQDKLKHILARHEQGAIHAAQGYARSSGKVGVAIATSGPGATNLVTGIADAQIDSTPVVCITGQVPSHLLGSDAFQETDIIGISMPVTSLSKLKAFIQMFAISVLLTGDFGNKIINFQDYNAQTIGIILLWLSAFLTLYTGYDYLRKGIDHAISYDSKD